MSELIGKKISNRLKDQGKTQEWLAEIAKVSINAVSKWTKTGKISRERLPVVADALGMSVDELLTAEPSSVKLASETRLERLDAEESEVLEKYRRCADAQRKVVREQLDIFIRAAAISKAPSAVRNKP